MMVKPNPMVRSLPLGHENPLKDAWNLAKVALKMGFITRFLKKTQKCKKRLQMAFYRENLFGK